MMGLISSIIGKSKITKWLRERALHVPEDEVHKISKHFGVDVETWRAIEVFLAERAAEAVDLI